MNENSEPSAKSEPKTALILPVFSEDDTYHPGQFSGPDTGGAHWLNHDEFFQSLLGGFPQPEIYHGEDLSEILAAGENTIICSRICGSVANAIGEFAGRFILEGPQGTQDVVNDYISKCYSEICAVSKWSQQLRLGPDSSCYHFESSARCTDANRLSVLIRAVPVTASIQVSYVLSLAEDER